MSNPMKKFLTLLTIALSLVFISHSCKPDSEDELLQESGSIYGVVTDFATGEPVKNANVQLRPSGETTLTGSDGRYEFLDLPNGNYSITVSKAEYTDLIDDFVITVNGSKAMRRDVQIEKLPAALKVVDDNGNDINELDFGNSPDDVSRMFNIFNNGSNTLVNIFIIFSFFAKLIKESNRCTSITGFVIPFFSSETIILLSLSVTALLNFLTIVAGSSFIEINAFSFASDLLIFLVGSCKLIILAPTLFI